MHRFHTIKTYVSLNVEKVACVLMNSFPFDTISNAGLRRSDDAGMSSTVKSIGYLFDAGG